MLDLKKLEERLDVALSNETSESLTIWLQNKRLHAYMKSLGEGTFKNISLKGSNVVLKSQTKKFIVLFSDVLFSEDYPIAA